MIVLACAWDNAAMAAELIPLAAKAVLSGANTVNGPGPLNVVAKSAFTTASFNKLRFASATTLSVMVFEVGAGSSSLSLSQLVNTMGRLNDSMSAARKRNLEDCIVDVF